MYNHSILEKEAARLKDLLKNIKPCNMGNPYIFISYSARDAEHVWQDVYRFQQMGYNIWLDERNLDKTKDSWREDAMTAIRDMDCMLLVFYVSRHSLVSQACFSELSCTVEEYTRAVHFGPVKFIAVDVEPIGDIVEFSREVYTQIRKKDISKEEKTTQAITLHKCIEEFFNSNNEKVRVRPRDMEGRKMDYYEEITAVFPDETRLFVPQPVNAAAPQEKAVPVAPAPVVEVVPEVQSQPVAEPVREVPAPAETEVPPVAVETPPVMEAAPVAVENPPVMEAAPVVVEKPPVAEAEPVKAAPAPVAEPEPVSAPQKPVQPLQPQDDAWVQAVENANQKLKDSSQSFQLKYAAELTSKQIQGAISAYAAGVKEEDVLAMMDTTLRHNGKEGYLLTKDTLYMDSWLVKTYPIAVNQVAEVQKGTKESYLTLGFLDGSQEICFFSIYSDAFLAFFQVFAQANRKNAGRKKKENLTPREIVRQAMDQANRVFEKGGNAFDFKTPLHLKEKQLRTARERIGGGVAEADVVGVMDTTLFGSGKEGYLITNKFFYSGSDPVDLSQVKGAKWKEGDYYVKLTFRDGTSRELGFSIYCAGMQAFFDYIGKNWK